MLCIGGMGLCTTNARADWYASATYSPGSAYIGDTVNLQFNLKNTGGSTFQIERASMNVEWGSATTTRTMTGAVAIAPGSTGMVSCSFTVPQVSPGTYTMLVTIKAKAVGDLFASTDSYRCNLAVKEVPPLSVSVQASKTSGQAPLSTTLSCSVNGGVGPYEYQWTLGDGTTSTQSTVSHKYSKGGMFTAVLVVHDSRGQISSDSVIINVQANPMDLSDTSGGINPLLLLGVAGLIAGVIIVVAITMLKKKASPPMPPYQPPLQPPVQPPVH